MVSIIFYLKTEKLLSILFLIKGPCGGLINNASGTFQTPNYPFYYPGFIECNWLIQVFDQSYFNSSLK